ncbi:uncharacterized protein C7orf50 homolog [Eurosta solidaginis]|uniref:uncharacterized protein C7orf50 homolog n=1 Tax=Eurosta solidaginis TaxID=178769 RepID=UPI0035314A33
MAKKETKSEHKENAAQLNKPRAKKRKHASKESDEEVASKSLIVESLGEEKLCHVKAAKRKHKDKGLIKEKRSKHETESENGFNTDGDHAIEGETDEPTLEQLLESEKPENMIAIVTVRQKKKQKHEQRLESMKDQTVSKERLRNEEYLRKWKRARAQWKFEKLRQISIQQTVFEEAKISIEMWPVALEYLSGSKGAAKAQIVKLAEQCIDELDKKCAELEIEEERQVIIDSTRYQRARDLLQSLD